MDNGFINWLQATFTDHAWIIEIFLIVFFSMLLHTLVTVFYHRIHKKLKKTHNFWDDSLLRALYQPLAILIWVVGISFAAEVAGKMSPDFFLFSLISPLRKIAILVLVTWFIIRFIRNAEENLLKPTPGKKTIDKTTLHAITQLLTVSTFITAVLVGMQMFNLPISGILAFGGVGGIGVALAAKDLLGNFFGGLMIYLDRPFKVGDWIRSPDRNIEGTVEHIGWRLTRIRTFDKRPLYVPNGVFSTISVENPSRMLNRRIRTNVGLRYDDAPKVAAILQDVETMLRNHPEIDVNQTLMVNLIEFGASSLNFMIYTFTKTTNWVKFQAIQQDVFLKVIDIITAHGAECAFPTQTLHIPEGLELTHEKQ